MQQSNFSGRVNIDEEGEKMEFLKINNIAVAIEGTYIPGLSVVVKRDNLDILMGNNDDGCYFYVKHDPLSSGRILTNIYEVDLTDSAIANVKACGGTFDKIGNLMIPPPGYQENEILMNGLSVKQNGKRVMINGAEAGNVPKSVVNGTISVFNGDVFIGNYVYNEESSSFKFSPKAMFRNLFR